MEHTQILTAGGKEKGKVDLAPTLFAAPVNEALIHQAVVRQLAGKRVGTADTLTRGQVRGGVPGRYADADARCRAHGPARLRKILSGTTSS